MFPFNLKRVLRGIQKPLPLTKPTVLKANKVVRSSLQDEVLQTPVTPVTPVTTDAVTSLQNLVKQDAYALNKTSKQRLQRHVQKLASAA